MLPISIRLDMSMSIEPVDASIFGLASIAIPLGTLKSVQPAIRTDIIIDISNKVFPFI